MQCFIRQYQAYMKALKHKALIHHIVKGKDPLCGQGQLSIEFFLKLLRDLALTGEFSNAYKSSETLLNTFQDTLNCDCEPMAKDLAYWSAAISAFLTASTYWSKYGPTRQLNLFILEKAIGTIMEFGSVMRKHYSPSSNAFISEDVQLARQSMAALSCSHSPCDILDVLYQLTNSPAASRLKKFDALVLKADILMMQVWLSSQSSLAISSYALPCIKAPANDIATHRIIRRVWKLLLRAKTLLSAGSSDQYELKFRLEFYSSLSQIPEASKEFFQFLPIVFVNRSQTSNFRGTPSSSLSGLMVMVRVQFYRVGFLVVVTGRIQDDSLNADNQFTRGKKLMKADIPISKGKVFSAMPSLTPEQKVELEGTASAALAVSDLMRPCILFANEAEYLGDTFDLYVARANRRASAVLLANSSGSSKKPVLDQRKLHAFLLDKLQVVLLLPAGPGVESPWQLSIPEIDKRRVTFLDSNDARFSALLIQRIYRGHRGKLRFAVVKRNYQAFKRKRWLAWKVLFHWRALRRKLDHNASLIQSRVKGYFWRKRLILMKNKIIYLQCMYRCYAARQRVQRERDRRRGGPAVIEMLRGGRSVNVGDRRFFLRIFRCGNNYRLQGTDMLRGAQYHGVVYAPELSQLVDEYNAAKNEKLRVWQYDQLMEYMLTHLALVNKITGGTNALGASSHDTDLILIVSNKLKGVFSDKPSVAVMPALNRPGRRQVARPLNNLELPTVRKLLPPLNPAADHTPVFVKLMRERKAKERAERSQYISFSYGKKK